MSKNKNVAKILIMGLDNSGKTSILLSLQKKVNLLTYYSLKPTKGINIVKRDVEERKKLDKEAMFSKYAKQVSEESKINLGRPSIIGIEKSVYAVEDTAKSAVTQLQKLNDKFDELTNNAFAPEKMAPTKYGREGTAKPDEMVHVNDLARNLEKMSGVPQGVARTGQGGN